MKVKRFGGRGYATFLCIVNTFEADRQGRCVVADGESCFGYMLYVPEYFDDAVVSPKVLREHLGAEGRAR